MGQNSDVPANCRCLTPDIQTGDYRSAGIGPGLSGQNPKECGLANPVCAQQCYYLAPRHCKLQAPENRSVPVAFLQAPDGDGIVHSFPRQGFVPPYSYGCLMLTPPSTAQV